ncbi:phage protein NinX family protein [Cronobacter sakazakii]|uniref:phage protein NinX family protein n=1 Tax=Cronobacter sakazakii TaxID=28141 RepID=UPI000CF07639|nr:phage protein NinX family protein [Cronobacter sakazakii]PPX94106.1 protein ninX [Cronobacter sakazakii]PPY31558.1 protein ninX [Cronobacter sakazakii]PPY49015.1 protein ninX [Cronobacter sakazakii]PQY76061.1 protein ninX [Cronobacter sakazakii]PQY87725.1 protein ninX [Cronobacter sakazakii]
MDYSQLEDTEITIRVGETFGWNPYFINEDGSVTFRDDRGRLKGRKNYCNNAADAWPIISKHRISIEFDGDNSTEPQTTWCHTTNLGRTIGTQYQKNPLRAAMITFLMMQESQHA